MGWVIGHGNSFIFRQGGRQKWSSYWTTRFPSNLILTVISSTRIDLSWTNNGTADYIGVSIERSADNINFSEIGTVVVGSTSYSDLTVTAGNVYYYRLRYYADSESLPIDPVIVNAEVTTYITGLTTPLSDSQIAKLDTLISALKTGLSVSSLADFFDDLVIFGGETQESSYKNIVGNVHHVTATAPSSWVQFEGIKGNGTSQFEKSNFIPSSDGSNYKQDDASFGLYIRENIVGSGIAIGTTDLIRGCNLRTRHSDGNAYFVINASAGSSGASSDSSGLWILSRGSATGYVVYQNKTTFATVTSNSIGLPTREFFIGAYNNNGTAQYFNNQQTAIIFFAKSISTAQRDIIVDAFEAYMDSNGKGIL